MSKDVKAYHDYKEGKKETYFDVVNKWKEYVSEMYKNTKDDVRIQRWSYSNGMFKYLNNYGGAISDNNPYLNFIDLDEFNLLVKNLPLPSDPPAFNNKNRPNFFGTMMDDYIDDVVEYKHHLHTSFERIRREATTNDVPKPNENKNTDLKKLKQDIIDLAKSFGFVSIGVTKVDRRFISAETDDEIAFDTMIILGYEIPKEIMQRYPEPKHATAAYYGYTHCAKYVNQVADFIREQGYDCRARCWEGFIKYPIHAVNAGMGNFTTYGICHTPEVGTRLKYTSILIDAEIELDKPRDFNIEEFCSRCRMCQKSCPENAIPKDEKRYMGTMRRATDHIKCFNSMAMRHECVQCIRVCPISMIGYETVKKSLPMYYQYNLMRNDFTGDERYFENTQG